MHIIHEHVHLCILYMQAHDIEYVRRYMYEAVYAGCQWHILGSIRMRWCIEVVPQPTNNAIGARAVSGIYYYTYVTTQTLNTAYGNI